MKKLVTRILFLAVLMFGINGLMNEALSQNQDLSTQSCVVGGFAIDSGVYANELEHGDASNGAGINDWFARGNGNGVGVIDESNPGEIEDLLRDGNNTYKRGMAFVGNTIINEALLLNAFYARDHAGGAQNTDLTIFEGGDKNADNPSDWGYDDGNVQGKNDIIDVAGHTFRGNSGDGDLYFTGLTSIRVQGGQAYRDFEFFVNEPIEDEEFKSAGDEEGRTAFGFDGDGTINKIGDLIILLSVDNDGVLSFEVRIWVSREFYNQNEPSNLPFTFGDKFDGKSNDSDYGYAKILPRDGVEAETCGYYNQSGESSDGPPWGVRTGSFQDDYDELSVFEVGFNLSEFGIDPSIVSNADKNVFPYESMIVKSRASASFGSDLKDFAGPYNLKVFDPGPASVGNFVWHDKNGNGIQDEDEPGVEGVTINLYDASGDKLQTTTSGEDGEYIFENIDITNINGDEFQIEFELPDGYQFTRPNQGEDPEKDSDAIPGNQIGGSVAVASSSANAAAENDNGSENGVTDVFTLMPGQDRTDIDAGLIETTTTIDLGGACYRMLSSPGEGATYSDLFAKIFTQGENVPSSKDDYHIEDGGPNVWVWPTDNDGNSDEDWLPLKTTKGFSDGLDTEIPAGTGVLLSMYELRSLDDLDDDGPFEIDLSGFNEHGATVNVNDENINQNPGGWTLAGNPFFTSIDFNIVHSESEDINGVVYIWDRDIGEPAFGGWRTYSVNLDEYPTTLGVGDIPNGKIHPYQGFFVQTADDVNGSPNLSFTNDSKSDGAEFYGKQRSNNLMRLELSGDRGKTSAWMVFGESGSFERLSNDAYEMEPMASDYMMLASRKADGTLFDIGHYPMPGKDFEIPVAVETSMPGNYTITATDFEMMIGQDLYFVDKETNTTLSLDESFSYDFTISNGAAKVPSPDVNRCSMEINKMSKNAGDDRFMITTKASANVDNDLPQDVELKQNYPNPFNPTTSIQYQLPESANVTLEVYNMLGQRVTVLAEGQQTAGSHTVEFDASDLSSGVYIYRLTAGSTVINKRMTLVK